MIVTELASGVINEREPARVAINSFTSLVSFFIFSIASPLLHTVARLVILAVCYCLCSRCVRLPVCGIIISALQAACICCCPRQLILRSQSESEVSLSRGDSSQFTVQSLPFKVYTKSEVYIHNLELHETMTSSLF